MKCPNRNGTINYMHHNSRYAIAAKAVAFSSGNFAKQDKGPLSFPLNDRKIITNHGDTLKRLRSGMTLVK
jgi:hypothetical protein